MNFYKTHKLVLCDKAILVDHVTHWLLASCSRVEDLEGNVLKCRGDFDGWPQHIPVGKVFLDGHVEVKEDGLSWWPHKWEPLERDLVLTLCYSIQGQPFYIDIIERSVIPVPFDLDKVDGAGVDRHVSTLLQIAYAVRQNGGKLPETLAVQSTERKYGLAPGDIVSAHDGDRHFVSENDLIRLNEIPQTSVWYTNIPPWAVTLAPVYSGDYKANRVRALKAALSFSIATPQGNQS